MRLVGQCFGLGEITTAEEIREGAAAGATIGRFNSRWLGNTTGTGYGKNFQRDSFAADQPHHVRPECEALLLWQLQTAADCGLESQLAMDSDQLQGRMGGFDAWTQTREARERRRQHIHLTRHYARVFGPLVSRIEVLVEPQGPNATKERVWDYQTESMLLALEVAPHLLFPIGCAQAYGAAYIGDAFCPDWATGELAGHIELTCNFQSDLVCNPPMFEERLARVLAARDRWGVQAQANQIWSFPAVDPDGALLARAIRRLSEEGVDSIVWTACTRYSGPDESAGLRYLANPNDPQSAHIKRDAIWANVTAAWQEANA